MSSGLIALMVVVPVALETVTRRTLIGKPSPCSAPARERHCPLHGPLRGRRRKESRPPLWEAVGAGGCVVHACGGRGADGGRAERLGKIDAAANAGHGCPAGWRVGDH